MALKKMEGFDTTPLAFIKTILSITGTWPTLEPSQRIIPALFISITFITSYILQISYILSSEFNIKSSLIYMAYLFTTVSMSIVYYPSVYKKRYIYSFLTKMLDDWVNIKNTKEYDVLIEYANYSRKCTRLFIVSYIFYSTFTLLQSYKSLFLDILIPLNKTRARTFIYPVSHYFERIFCLNAEKQFLEIVFVEYLMFLVMGASIISGISMIITALLHICAMFKIIGCLLDNILGGNEKGLNVIDNKVIYNKIIHIIRIHGKTFQYADMYNTNANVILLLVLMCAICFIGITTIYLMDNFEEKDYEDIGNLIILPMFYIIFHLIWIFMVCVIGQHLKNISESVFYKANATSWYLLSKESKILLYLIIARASKPTYLSVGNMFIASYEFFAQLVKLPVSYAMVIHSRN